MRGWFLDKWSVKQKTVDRPMLTVGLRPGSVGNVPVTCRSDGTDVERQLLFSANSHYRPNAVIGRLKGPQADTQVQQSFQPTAHRKVVGLMGQPVDAEKYLSQPA